MKLLTYRYKMFGPRAGVKLGEEVVDLTVLLGAVDPIRDVQDLLERYPSPVETIQQALDQADKVETLPLSEVHLCAPILQPPIILDSSIFEVHSKGSSKESGIVTPAIWYKRPVFYYQNPGVIEGPEAQITRKTGCTTLDYEAEVALVVGKKGRNVSPEKMEEYIVGLTIFNDWSDRAVCGEEVGFLGMHKSKDFESGLGPWVVTFDEFRNKYRDGRLFLKVDARVNGKTLTDSCTDDMYWTLPQLFKVVAEDTVILPGEVIGIGTVGHGCIHERANEIPYLSDGDTVEIEVEGIGTLRQYVKKAD